MRDLNMNEIDAVSGADRGDATAIGAAGFGVAGAVEGAKIGGSMGTFGGPIGAVVGGLGGAVVGWRPLVTQPMNSASSNQERILYWIMSMAHDPERNQPGSRLR